MRDMVVFGEDWGRHPSSTQHLIRRLAADCQIIWVNSLGLRRPRLSFADLSRVKAKAAAALSGPAQGPAPEPHPFVALVDPRAISWPGSRLAAAFNRRSLARQIRTQMRDEQMSRPILWTSLPTAAPVVGALDEAAVVYYAGDDFAALAGVDHAPVLEMERSLAARADLVIAASPLIASRFDKAKTRVLEHGVDFDLFSTRAEPAADLPYEQPVAGFYGSINAWIDVDAIASAADALPGWRFVLIGKIETDVTRLRQCRNVTFLGPRPHGDLPRYSQHWDLSLLPFRRNRQIDASNPLKMREYLAAGAPVLASYRFPAAMGFGDAISAVREGETFAEAILRAKNDSRSSASRQILVKDESWDAKAALLKSWLQCL